MVMYLPAREVTVDACVRAMSIPWLGWSKAPPSLADAFMRDPVGALSPRRPTAAVGSFGRCGRVRRREDLR